MDMLLNPMPRVPPVTRAVALSRDHLLSPPLPISVLDIVLKLKPNEMISMLLSKLNYIHTHNLTFVQGNIKLRS